MLTAPFLGGVDVGHALWLRLTSLRDMTLHRSPAGFLGVLMLDTRFPRVPGDVGNPASFAIPVKHRVVAGASPQRVVRDGDPSLLQPFVDAAKELVHEGARAITTSCGFLVQFQATMQAALPVPVWTSSLLKLPDLTAPGVITVDALSLGSAHLRAAGVDATVPVVGLAQDCHLQRALLDDLPAIDATLGRRRRGRCGATPGGALADRARDRAGVHQHAALCQGRGARHAAAGAPHHQLSARALGRAAVSVVKRPP